MTAERKQLEKDYKAALAVWNKLALGNDLAAWEQADLALNICRKNLVESELSSPTLKEIKQRNNLLRLRNRGLDV